MDTGHWRYTGRESFPEVLDELFGFVYRITNLSSAKSYIGKKQFWSISRRAVKGKKRKTTVKSESNWRDYTSSSRELNEDIQNLGKQKFMFEILSIHKTKAELSFAETMVQWKLDVLRAKLPDGSRAFYNGRIEPIRWNQLIANKVTFGD